MTKRWRRLAAPVAALTALAVPCRAQDDAGDSGPLFQAVPLVQPGPPRMPETSTWADRFRTLEVRAEQALDALNARGIHPDVGSLVSGSGLAGGGRLRVPSFGGSRIGAELGAMWSVRGYREYHARLGIVGDAHDTLELERPDGNVTSISRCTASSSAARSGTSNR